MKQILEIKHIEDLKKAITVLQSMLNTSKNIILLNGGLGAGNHSDITRAEGRSGSNRDRSDEARRRLDRRRSNRHAGAEGGPGASGHELRVGGTRDPNRQAGAPARGRSHPWQTDRDDLDRPSLA